MSSEFPWLTGEARKRAQWQAWDVTFFTFGPLATPFSELGQFYLAAIRKPLLNNRRRPRPNWSMFLTSLRQHRQNQRSMNCSPSSTLALSPNRSR
jgi:hypothetical protein